MQNTWEPSGRRASETRSEMLSTLALLGGLAGHNHHSTSPISLKFNLSPPKYCSPTCILAFCLCSAMPEGRCHPHTPNLSAPGICTHPAGSVAWGCTREAAALGCCPRPSSSLPGDMWDSGTASGPPRRQLGACRLPPPRRAPGMSQLFGGAARGQANPNPRGWESERQMWANFLA